MSTWGTDAACPSAAAQHKQIAAAQVAEPANDRPAARQPALLLLLAWQQDAPVPAGPLLCAQAHLYLKSSSSLPILATLSQRYSSW